MLLTTTTDELFDTLVELLTHEYVNLPTFKRIGRLATIIACREGLTREYVLAGAGSAALNRPNTTR